MERLFTSITNAGQTATQNKNNIQTGYYTGEREDFMRENLFKLHYGVRDESRTVAASEKNRGAR